MVLGRWLHEGPSICGNVVLCSLFDAHNLRTAFDKASVERGAQCDALLSESGVSPGGEGVPTPTSHSSQHQLNTSHTSHLTQLDTHLRKDSGHAVIREAVYRV